LKNHLKVKPKLVPLEILYAMKAKVWITPEIRRKLIEGKWGLTVDDLRIVKRRPRAYGLGEFQALIESGDPDRMVA